MVLGNKAWKKSAPWALASVSVAPANRQVPRLALRRSAWGICASLRSLRIRPAPRQSEACNWLLRQEPSKARRFWKLAARRSARLSRLFWMRAPSHRLCGATQPVATRRKALAALKSTSVRSAP